MGLPDVYAPSRDEIPPANRTWAVLCCVSGHARVAGRYSVACVRNVVLWWGLRLLNVGLGLVSRGGILPGCNAPLRVRISTYKHVAKSAENNSTLEDVYKHGREVGFELLLSFDITSTL